MKKIIFIQKFYLLLNLFINLSISFVKLSSSLSLFITKSDFSINSSKFIWLSKIFSAVYLSQLSLFIILLSNSALLGVQIARIGNTKI